MLAAMRTLSVSHEVNSQSGMLVTREPTKITASVHATP